MSIKSFLLSDKKRTGLILFAIIFVIGISFLYVFTFHADPANPYTINQITLYSEEDDTRISALVYKPQNTSGTHPGIVVGHGFCESKQFMNVLSIELVKRQFVVVAIDYRGHGSSDGYLDQIRENRSSLLGDEMAAVNYLKSLSFVDNDIGLIGHSMGGGVATTLAAKYPSEFNATVCLGSIPSAPNTNQIQNLLIALGPFEQGATRAKAIEYMSYHINESNPVIGQLYGDFDYNNASKVFIGGATEHLFVPQNSVLIEEAVKWFEIAFHGTIRYPITLTSNLNLVFYIMTICGLIGINFVIMIMVSNYLWKKKPFLLRKDIVKDRSILGLILYYFLVEVFSFIGLIAFQDIFTDVLPVSLGNALFAELIGIAIGVIIVSYFAILRKENLGITKLPKKMNELTSKNWGRSIIFGIISAIIFTTTVTLATTWSNSPILLTTREIGAIIGMTLLFFPLLLFKEFYYRTIQSKLKTEHKTIEYFEMLGIAVFIDNILVVPIMLIAWGDTPISFVALALFVFILFSIIQQIITTWVYMYSGRNIVGSTLFLSIMYAWMIVNFFPFGFTMSLIH
ncbi:MAG: alpha/beta fold hydrolase [Promethearchaeota archaeon]|nr:MAG: alpha/beta fold hydrolase [Candidatus Lokiarchaeota archaeon]